MSNLTEESKNTNIVCLLSNTTTKPYANFTDKIIEITKGGQTIILEPENLKLLEKVVGGKFQR